jgi:pimeloyl-ACP methyl ester carboxylesterase
MEKHFIKINKQSVFYCKKGSGPYLVLLHPSPRNSAMMAPLMNLLADTFTVIAWDLPGYGQSDKLPFVPQTIYDYLPFLDNFINTVCANNPVYIYGTATGAQLAIAYALRYPKKVRHLCLDNVADFTELERTEILQHYFIDITPTDDATHLTRLWNHVKDSCLYFPWYSYTEENRIADSLPSATMLQIVVNDYLQAGAQYADAYRCAFLHEKIEHIQQLTVPTTIFKWRGSPLWKYMDRITPIVLPNAIAIVETPIDHKERYTEMKKIMQLIQMTKEKE